MKPDTLRHFSQQLQSWCAERLTQKPGPFRLAESLPRLLGREGHLSPPIVLWINRESCIAGGVILLPQKEEEEIFSTGREMAKALGLSHFHTWGRHEISCWSVEYNPPEKLWEHELPIEDAVSPAAFRKGFNLLLDQMEQHFFEQQQQIPLVSDLYLTNLFHTSFSDMFPEIQKVYQGNTLTSKSEAADIKNLLFRTMLTPIAIVGAGLSLHGTSPDDIIESLRSALIALPPSLRQSFAGQSGEPRFPAECQRRLYHYCNRIERLAPRIAPIIVSSVERLLQEYARDLGGHPVQGHPANLKQAVINSDRLDLTTPPVLEVGKPGILAATTLIRYFSVTEVCPAQQLPTLFSLTQVISGTQTRGTLNNLRIPKASEQKELNAHLRTSWPNRKLALSGKTPLWAWEFLHLCGLSGESCQIDLTLPADWLREPYGEKLVSILTEKHLFTQIRTSSSEQLFCRLRPRDNDPPPLVEITGEKTRRISHEPAESLRARIILALHLPDEIFQLFESGQLQPYPEENIEEFPVTGLVNYLGSSLGQGLWKLLAAGKPFPKQEKLAEELSRKRMPFPDSNIMAQLSRLKTINTQTSKADIDQELSVWLGSLLPEITYDSLLRRREKVPGRTDAADKSEQLMQRCCAEEIPLFPDDYLYDTPLSERVSYQLSGQLTIIDSFFDQVTLGGPGQQKMTVNGLEQAKALLLASSFRTGSVELPKSETATASMNNRYLRDLGKLQQIFTQLVAGALLETDTSDFIEKVWQRLPLPDRALITGK